MTRPASTSTRIAIDVGGTFTDLIIETGADQPGIFKSPTTPDNPIEGVVRALDTAAQELGSSREELLRSCSHMLYATTAATNALISRETARTALLVTKGHRDLLLWRENGRETGTFDFTVPYPKPYVPRRLTFEVPERIGAGGEIVEALDENAVLTIVGALESLEVEAVAVCLLWSVINPAHERRLGELLSRHLAGVPFTLSHALNPVLREYRRASSTAIDASLKPLIGAHFRQLSDEIRAAGFGGRLLVMTSAGGMLEPDEVIEQPIHTINSGPAAAPVAGRGFARDDADRATAIVTDAGGTSFEVSVVRNGEVAWTRDTWLGGPYAGQITGFPSINVESIGAGGGSIASVDAGGLLHVGPASAGAVPGPACYGRGGRRATVTDACLTLGYLNPAFFLGGRMSVRPDLARAAIARDVAEPLEMSVESAAAAILRVCTERMIMSIEDVVIGQGIDPRDAVLISGGGSGGFYAAEIAHRLGMPRVVVPPPAAALSTAGLLMCDLVRDFRITHLSSTAAFPRADVNASLRALRQQCEQFVARSTDDERSAEVTFAAEARYPQQIWELEVPLAGDAFESQDDVDRFHEAFHDTHEEILGVADRGSEVEIMVLRARARCRVPRREALWRPDPADRERHRPGSRELFFDGQGFLTGSVWSLDDLAVGEELDGPGVVESPATTIVLPGGAHAVRLPSGSLSITVRAGRDTGPQPAAAAQSGARA